MVRVVVPVKQVASIDDDFELEEGTVTVHPDYLELDLNEWDEFSVEAALRIKEAEGEAEVVVVTVGAEEADEALLACLAKGADRAVRVWDRSLEDLDPLAVAAILAAIVEQESPDLVLCGVQSSDAASGATGIALAGLLELPHVAVVCALEFDSAKKTVDVDRELEDGLIEQLTLPTPALLTIQTGINDPRYATLRAIKQAAEKPLARLGLDDVGLSPAALLAVRGARTVALASPPQQDGGASMLDGDPARVAAQILEIVHGTIGNGSGAKA